MSTVGWEVELTIYRPGEGGQVIEAFILVNWKTSKDEETKRRMRRLEQLISEAEKHLESKTSEMDCNLQSIHIIELKAQLEELRK